MKFISFKFENFKGIDSLSLDLQNSKKPICLLGLNESGKTTILQAIYILGKLCRGNVLENGERLSIRPKGFEFTGDIIFQAEVILEKADITLLNEIFKESELSLLFSSIKNKKFKIKFVYSFEDHSFKNSNIKINDFSILLDKKGEKLDLYQKFFYQFIKFYIPSIIYYDDFVFDVPNIIYFSNEIDFLKKEQNNEEWQRILNDIYNSISTKKSESNFINNVVNWLDTNKDDLDAVRNRLLAMGTKLNEVISKKWKEIEKNNLFNKIVISQNEKLKGYSIYLESNNQIYMLHERSKGFKWFFTFLILTEFRKHREKNTVFLLDEPASNLHPEAQEKIIYALNSLSEDSHVVYSTHSPYLLDYKNLDNIRIVQNNRKEYENPKIKCFNLEEGLKRNQLNDLKPLLDYISFKLPLIYEFIEKNQKNTNFKDKLKGLKNKLSSINTKDLSKYKEDLYFIVGALIGISGLL